MKEGKKQTANPFDMPQKKMGWCPGCGNYRILDALKGALHESGIDRRELVIVSGIGQAAKTPQYVNANMFNGLHGRALPAALGVKLARPDLVVVAESGDGCMYGEGGNHFLHAIRRNADITVIVHNNMVYGLTKGQASPTSMVGMTTPVQVEGVMLEPFNPLAVALSLGAPFVARASAGDGDQTKDIFKQALAFKGVSVVDVFQPCVVFNKLNTYKWFSEHTFYLDSSHDVTDRMQAIRISLDSERLALGVLYRHEGRETYEELLGAEPAPLGEQRLADDELQEVINSFR
ncbi:2-oxoacid ferredoxin oxidoreductase [Prosthecochloris sp. N3]|uniref:2-oxoacid ferredoxin oxidoreductase n=1 Tax=Prosthecochloris ethylica TaxID=2743976 RepID=A0ABR9XQA5_9CHLB|nr:thiamine pyrophosphate-dependent enzyme [Prosthecochloris ethylica]MBF0585451.1 2-oxoacid ferredoxin oxidoreductase [Prosthecochloris ethylica]MBF0636237.1 2-oxoacid ferredoxin oxidoreductase [Prosthecochloris ethylica]NUK46681.1 2-oxoacid ferredoxin oxidoreductase [Prosthecochloris ethylica]